MFCQFMNNIISIRDPGGKVPEKNNYQGDNFFEGGQEGGVQSLRVSLFVVLINIF